MSSETEIIRALGTRFIERRDVKAIQSENGSWFPVKCAACRSSDVQCLHKPMNLQDFKDHLSGQRTLGYYLVNPTTQTCKLIALDLDVRKPNKEQDYVPHNTLGNPTNPREDILKDGTVEQANLYRDLLILAEGFARRMNEVLGIPVAIAYSGGKGMHVYGFTGSIPANAAVDLVQNFMKSWSVFSPTKGENFWRHDLFFQDIDIETFPKQSSVDKAGYGNLMGLPLGVNRKTGRAKYFVTTRSRMGVLKEMDAVRALEGDLPWE